VNLFKATYEAPIPERAEILTHNGRKYVNVRDHNGRIVRAYLTADGKRCLKPQRKYTGPFRDYHGTVRRVALASDKEASQKALNDLTRHIDQIRAGTTPDLNKVSPIIRTKVEEALQDAGKLTAGYKMAQTSLDELFTTYLEHLEASGRTQKHRKDVRRYLKTVAAECNFRYIRDICVRPVQDLIITKRNAGLSCRTVNLYADRIRYFCTWAVKRKLLDQNPFADFTRLNERTNRAREARALTPEEVERLLDAAFRRPLVERRKKYKRMQPSTVTKLTVLGEGRRLGYALMIYTGLRVNETRQLIWADVDLKGEVLQVRATTTKNSKPATLPLHPYVVALLTDWEKRKPEARPNDRIVNIPSSTSSLLKVLNRDLAFARIPKKDDVGQVIHLHALRHTFTTLLARADVPPHVLKHLARHSNVQTTMQHYTHVLRGDDIAAIQKLPRPSGEQKGPDKAAG